MNGERLAACIALMDCANRYPDLRLCQIIVNATEHRDPFYVTDDSLALALVEYAEAAKAAKTSGD